MVGEVVGRAIGIRKRITRSTAKHRVAVPSDMHTKGHLAQENEGPDAFTWLRCRGSIRLKVACEVVGTGAWVHPLNANI
jgi:hypothetical protein